MNILIVGNGFDLSHYLPTKYDHFMDVMGAIEKKNTGGKVPNLTIHSVSEWMEIIDDMCEKKDFPEYSMKFDELLSETREPYFIEKTKEIYFTGKIKLSAKDVIKLQYRLELNCWYQYFKNHVEEIKTWIDFEQKIESALTLVLRIINKINLKFEKYGKTDTAVRFLTKMNSNNEDEKIYIHELDMDLLIKLGLLSVNNNYGRVTTSELGNISDRRKGFINDNWFHVKEKIEHGFSSEKYISFLNSQLEDFIEIFNLYLKLIINDLKPIKKLEIFVKSNSLFDISKNEWACPNKIYSFNYTNTYRRIHDSVSVKVEYLHGRHGNEHNIVLGVSDLEDDYLKKIKAYGFTKYHQKLFKDTDYLFLDKYKQKIKQHNLKVEYFEKDSGRDDPTVKKFTRQQLMEKEGKLDLNISIWGHSLDVSDQDYIKDLFSLNDDMDRNVRVTVFYFDKNAKFSLLNNLLAILGKDKVEHWMKKGWLKFEKNPEIKFT